MSWKNPMEENSTLRDPMRIIKICHEEGEWIFIIFLIWILAFRKSLACILYKEYSLWVLVNQFRGSWILIQIRCWRGHTNLSFGAEWSVLVAYWMLIQVCLIYFPFLSSHLTIPHVFIWWHTCENGGYAWLRLVNAKYWVHYVWLCNMVSLLSVSGIIKNTCAQIPTFQAIVWLFFMSWLPFQRRYVSRRY